MKLLCKWAICLLVWGCVWLPLTADNGSLSNINRQLVVSQKILHPGDVVVLPPVDLGVTTIQGLDWVLSSSSAISLEIQWRASNSYGGPWAYPQSVNSTPTTIIMTITTAVSSTDLLLAPIRYEQPTLHNTGIADLTITRLTMFAQ